jgi:arginine exporter protein ArgO
MRWVAVVVLTAWAIRTAVTALRRHRNPTVARSTTGLATPWRAYGGLLGLTLLNPGTIVYFGALVLGRQAAAQLSVPAGTVFVAAAFTASASWQLLLAGGGTLLGRGLTSARGRLITASASSAVIIVLAVNILTTT